MAKKTIKKYRQSGTVVEYGKHILIKIDHFDYLDNKLTETKLF